ncbi:AlbA family DNA-binding domain-containing protein [Aquimarina sp. 2201CG14-23]|uniref:AlbA family DNA-binding domain-containing protein n=1 Tax=Aquimarina mycalae TaxID=3040073 RepID=UPI002477F1BA|nr:ATP-binding protein [Aquimarina sp. 2201CG14-23]MDH7448412.1 ATP-binding protein [Aquimarina sp. 2201CG14-23]
MDIDIEEIEGIIGLPESSTLEYKAVLPPSGNLAQMISAFANSKGGYIILGVSDLGKVLGLSNDFNAPELTRIAISKLSLPVTYYYKYLVIKGKKIFAIKIIEKDGINVSIQGKTYKRVGEQIKLLNPSPIEFKKDGFKKIIEINIQLQQNKEEATNSLNNYIEHCQSILKIIDNLDRILYPVSPKKVTTDQEGKILTRILFSSFVDNFEAYLSDLLYEIYLSEPSTLKSGSPVTVEEVLNCSDMEDFIKYCAKKRLLKLQKGSVKGFIKDNSQIRNLNIIDKNTQETIEKILQIRHLYSHRNGIVDDKFLQFFSGEFQINQEHQLSINEVCNHLIYLFGIASKIDFEALTKYKLSKIN